MIQVKKTGEVVKRVTLEDLDKRRDVTGGAKKQRRALH
jgi:hypothetical protein